MVHASRPDGAAMVLAAAAHGVEEFITRHGGDIDRIAGRAGLSPRQFALPTEKLDLSAYCRLFSEAARDTQDGNIGLRFGQQFRPDMLGLIGYVALLSPTLGDAVANLASHFGYHQAHTRTGLIRRDGLLHLEYVIEDPRITQRRHDAELTMGMFCNVLRHAMGPDWAPEEIHFAHARPEQAHEHADAFQAPVRFGQMTNALVFREKGTDIPMPNANPSLLKVVRSSLISLAGAQCEVPAGSPLSAQIAGHIRSALAVGHIEFVDIARRMGLPPWTLQRRLAQENLTYSTILEETRHAEALRYLTTTSHDISEIARALAYTETSAFSRAFRKWSGQSPRAYRKQNMA